MPIVKLEGSPYFQDTDSGMVLSSPDIYDDVFVTSLRGAAAANLANFYDMAYTRGINMATALIHNAICEIDKKNAVQNLTDKQNEKVW